MTAVDFSFSRPSIAQLKAAGVTVVIRYLTGAGKAISKAELQSYLAAGIAVVFVFEVSATDGTAGFTVGQQHAAQANAALQLLELSPSTPVYFAADADIPNPQAAVPYWQGIDSVRPWPTNGVYGEGALCQLLHDDGLTAWYWQSESTSFPENATALPITHIWQKFYGAPLAGTDLDLLLKFDVGQVPRPTPQPTPVPLTNPEEITMGLPSNCADAQAVRCAIRDWWATYRSDAMTADEQNLLQYCYALPQGQKGFGGSPDLLLANIIDGATVKGTLRPQFSPAV